MNSEISHYLLIPNRVGEMEAGGDPPYPSPTHPPPRDVSS